MIGLEIHVLVSPLWPYMHLGGYVLRYNYVAFVFQTFLTAVHVTLGELEMLIFTTVGAANTATFVSVTYHVCCQLELLTKCSCNIHHV